MAASIVVRFYRSKLQQSLQGYDLRVVAVSAVEMPVEIFVFQRGVAPAVSPDAQGGQQHGATDQFCCLADPVDLEEFPVGAPDLANEIPYYRVADVTLRFRSVDLLAEAQGLIADDIQALVTSLNSLTDIELMEEVQYV